MKTTNSKLVCVVLLNWNHTIDTLQCIESIQLSSYDNIHIIVVDNGTKPYPKELELYSSRHVTIIFNNSNLGFAKGCNVGIKEANSINADYIFLLNNDTVIAKDTISTLVDTANSTENLGILGCKIFYFDKKDYIWFAGEQRNKNTGFRKYFGKNHTDYGQFSGVKICNNITGCAMFIPADVLDVVGGFDERFFAYSEDIDLCIRIEKAGYLIACERSSVLWHKESLTLGKTSPLKIYFSIRNRLLVISKHCKPAHKFFFLMFQHIYMALVLCCKYMLLFKFKCCFAFIGGVVDFHCDNFGKGRYRNKL